jgi:RNA polymerase sigma-70 factor (ECF subfamily)
MSPADDKTLDPSEWVEEHGDALYRFALLRVKDPIVAEDLVQETFLSALKGIGGFKGGSSLRTWMVGILKHKIIDHYRKAKPEILASDLATMEKETEAERLDRSDQRRKKPSPWHGDPAKLLEDKEFWVVLMSCLDSLPETHRKAFSLREIDGIKGDEICKILNVTSTNLWVILHRARLKLRNCLGSNWFKTK